ncbi:MAG: aminotransferase class IV [Saprospiraceae bacterium]
MITKDRIIFNGQLAKKKDIALNLDNRGFRYGDGIFETIRMFDGKLPFLENHINRLQKGIDFLDLDLSIARHGIDFWRFEIRRIVKYYRQKYPKQAKNYRLRLAIFRNDGGFYTPKTSKASYILELSPLEKSKFEWNKKGVKIDIFNNIRLSNDKLSNLKTSNGLPYVLAALHKNKHDLDDCLLLNGNGNIAESIHSNIFIVKENKLITPDLNQGCTAGTTRQTILQIAKTMKMEVIEESCSVESLADASEIFLTNAIRGIQWVGSFRKKTYENIISKKIHKQLNKIVKQSTITI